MAMTTKDTTKQRPRRGTHTGEPAGGNVRNLDTSALFQSFLRWLDTDEGQRAVNGDGQGDDENDEQGDDEQGADAGGIEGVKLGDIDSMVAEAFASAEEGGDFDPLARDNGDDENEDDDPKREAARSAGVRRSVAVKAMNKRSARKGR